MRTKLHVSQSRSEQEWAYWRDKLVGKIWKPSAEGTARQLVAAKIKEVRPSGTGTQGGTISQITLNGPTSKTFMALCWE